MATTYTWTYADTETINGSYIIDNNNVTVRATGWNITITPPASTISLKSNVSGPVKYLVQPRRLTYTKDDGSSAYKIVGNEFLSASVAQGTKVAFPSSSVTLYADDLFSEENPTEAYKDCQLKFPSSTSIIGTTLVHTDSGIERPGGPQNQITVGTIRVLLDVPPTATVSTLSFDTPYIYTGLTTASVIVSDTAAYYGGTIADVTLTIGNQSDSISGDGTLSIALDTAGTFTPTVTITDSRGQTYTETLTPITVNTYTAPSVSFDADRTNSSGQPDDEGTYGLITATLTFADVVATAIAPSVVLTDENGTQTTPTVTWYTDDTLTTTVTWSSLSSGDVVYGIFSGLNTQYSYQVSVRPRDSEGTGEAIVQTISSAFYTVDFLAGGHGIAFGQAATQTGFWCKMDAHFVDANATMRALFDFIYPVGSYYETSDTTFDPNVTWGGIWALETEGQVHVSAGSNYTVAGALTDTTDGGAATVTLQQSEMPAHTHGNKSLTGTMRAMAWTGAAVSGIVTKSDHNVNRNDNSGSNLGAATFTINASHEHTSVGGGQAHENMPPYIIVNRWHRTA